MLEEWTDDYEEVYDDDDDSNEPTKPDAANQALVAAARFNQKQVKLFFCFWFIFMHFITSYHCTYFQQFLKKG